MAYSAKERSEIIDKVCRHISEGGVLRTAFEEANINSYTFFKWMDKYEAKAKQYARAMSSRADAMAEQILEIADETSKDSIYTDKGEVENKEWVNRSKIKIDARKWLMSKMNPKKYGDKLEVDGIPPNTNTTVKILGIAQKELDDITTEEEDE